jgi:hypothetical protein
MSCVGPWHGPPKIFPLWRVFGFPGFRFVRVGLFGQLPAVLLLMLTGLSARILLFAVATARCRLLRIVFGHKDAPCSRERGVTRSFSWRRFKAGEHRYMPMAARQDLSSIRMTGIAHGQLALCLFKNMNGRICAFARRFASECDTCPHWIAAIRATKSWHPYCKYPFL